MKIIIGNHIDDSILLKRDDRIFTQRVIWFAEEGDIIILSCKPDPSFVLHVTSLTGVDASSLKFHVAPPGRLEGKHLDPHSLTDEKFLQELLSEDLANVTEIFPMWPSPAVAFMAEKLGLTDRLPGAKFMMQHGAELANNKAYFRVFATAAKIPIAPGEVCHSKIEAELAIHRLLNHTGAVMVKQAHNGAGAGNELVVRDTTPDLVHAGAKFVYQLSTDSHAVADYVEQRWQWATAQGRHPVVIEVFKPGYETIYAEFYAGDSDIRFMGSGRLGYSENRLTQESAPLRNVPDEVRHKLIFHGTRAASIYHSFGYRGYLSTDAIVNEAGDVVFTEINARVGGSLHIYDSIARRVVDVSRFPERTVVQHHSPLNWGPVDFSGFLTSAEELGVLYDPARRKGVLLALPIIEEIGCFMTFCIVYETEDEEREIYRALDDRFSQITLLNH